jgi:transposase InsO family protein
VEHEAQYSIELLCRVLQVSRSGYYDWRGRPESKRSAENRELTARIIEIHKDRRKRNYGSPRVHNQLEKDGVSCGRHRVARLMRVNGIRAEVQPKFKVTTDSDHQRPVAPNILAREFEAVAPNQKWAGDITYIWTAEGWLYLAVIIDLFSRKVIGWSMMPRMTADLVNSALRMAIANRLPFQSPLMHSDRGSQYASGSYQKILRTFGITCSMSRKGNCWDNAVSESFFATLKKESVYQTDFATRAEARAEIFDYIEVFYNRERFHSALGGLSPCDFEEQLAALPLAA